MTSNQILVTQFAEARAIELNALNEAANKQYGYAAKEKNSKRRRTNAFLSHKRSVKARAAATTEGNKKTRRARRNRKELLSTHRCCNTNNTTETWLTTHVWHAKRMKMKPRWGYAIPEYRLDKSISAAHRASCDHATVYDYSYCGVLELLSEDDGSVLKNLFKQCMDPAVFNDQFESSSSYFRTVMYHPNSFPFNAIGPVEFQWMNNSNTRCLWLWVHAACYSVIHEILQAYQESVSNSFTITDRRLDFSRLELRGKSADLILKKVFRSKMSEHRWNTKRSSSTVVVMAKDIENVEKLRFESNYNVILDECDSSYIITDSNSEIIQCPVTGMTVQEQDVQGHCEKLLEETSVILYEDQSQQASSSVPINNNTLVRKDKEDELDFELCGGNEKNQFNAVFLSHSCGWDVIIKPEKAPSVLKALVFAGARVMGRAERRALFTLNHQLSFPEDFPDTAAGVEYWNEAGASAKAVHDKRPKAKQTPYHALHTNLGGVFQPNFNRVLGNDSSKFCVLRGENYFEPFPFCNEGNFTTDDVIPMAIKTLVPVLIRMPRRGNPNVNALICMPSAEDYVAFENSKWNGDLYEKKQERRVIGQVTSSVYDKRNGAPVVVGFACCTLVQQLLVGKNARGLALVRDVSSRQYRPAFVTVMTKS